MFADDPANDEERMKAFATFMDKNARRLKPRDVIVWVILNRDADHHGVVRDDG